MRANINKAPKASEEQQKAADAKPYMQQQQRPSPQQPLKDVQAQLQQRQM